MEAQSSTSPSQHLLLATHSRACATCARAKAKCVAAGKGDKCERCHRLKKVCEPARALLRNQPRKRRPTPINDRVRKSHVEELVEKLDSLVTELKSSQGSRSNNKSSVSVGPNTTPPFTIPIPNISNATEIDKSQLVNQREGLLFLQSSNGGSSTQPVQTLSPKPLTPFGTSGPYNGLDFSVLRDLEPSSEESTLLLNVFRNQMIPFFPFIVLSPSVSAQDLYRERPFLFKSIMAIASCIPSQQMTLGKELVEQLAARMVVHGERSLDLLLGVLTYIGWCHYNCFNQPQLTCLLSLGLALIYDLGLNRPPVTSMNRSVFEQAMYAHGESSNPDSTHQLEPSATLEEQRALLGIFFLSSVLSTSLRNRIDPLRFTSYIDDCLETLDTFQDNPNDTCATSLVKLQIIADRITQCPWNGKPEILGVPTPAMLFVKSLQEQLNDFRNALPREVAMRGFVLLHYYHVEVSLYEVGFSKSPVLATPTNHDFQRLELLYACLQANKLFFETFFAIPAAKYFCFSLTTWTQLKHSLNVLQLLSNFDHPDWSPAYVRETIDFMEILDKLIDRFNKATVVFPFRQNGIFSRIAKKFASMKEHIQEGLAVGLVGQRTEPVRGEDPDMREAWEPVDFLDEAWLEDIMGPLYYQFGTESSESHLGVDS